MKLDPKLIEITESYLKDLDGYCPEDLLRGLTPRKLEFTGTFDPDPLTVSLVAEAFKPGDTFIMEDFRAPTFWEWFRRKRVVPMVSHWKITEVHTNEPADDPDDD